MYNFFNNNKGKSSIHRFLFIFLFFFLITSVSATTLSTSSTDFTYGDLKIEPQLELDKIIDTKIYLLENSGDSFYLKLLDDKQKINLTEFYWKLNFNPDEEIDKTCQSSNQFISTCINKLFDDSDFLNKNKIDKREILVKDNKGIFYSIANWFLYIIGLDTIPEHEYYIHYLGEITDLDPSLIEIITSTTAGTYNRTKASSLGLSNNPPVLYMDFNEPSEQPINTKYFKQNQGVYVKDKSTSNNFGTIDGISNQTIMMQEGKSGTGITFDGVNDYLILGTLDNYKVTNKTISFWAKPSHNYTGTIVLFSGASTNYYIGFGANSRMVWSYTDASTNQITAFSNNDIVKVNEWHHYTLYLSDYNGSTVIRKFYVDGNLNTENNGTTGTSNSYGSTWRIGTYTGGGNFVNGSLDEMQVYNCSLNDTEILNINNSVGYEANCPTMDKGLVSWWRFNATSNNPRNVTDEKNIRNATLINFETTSPTYNTTGGYDGSPAYEFDGVDDFIYLPVSSVVTISGEFTITGWFNPKNIHLGTQPIYTNSLSGSNRIGVILDNAVVKGFYYNGSNYIGDAKTITENNTWYFFTYSMKSGVHNLTINAIEGTGTTTSSLQATVAQAIGSRTDGTYSFNGTIDEFKIFDYVLSQDEILNLYNGSIGNSSYKGKYARQGDWTSGVFYNQTISNWTINLSIADTYSSRNGIVNSDNSINLSNPNLVSYWAFDGNYVDALGRSNGTPFNGTNNASGISSQAIQFDGVNDYVGLGLAGVTGNISISLWVNSKGLGAVNGLIGSTATYRGSLRILTTGTIIYRYSDNTDLATFSGATLLKDNWYNVLFTFNPTTGRIEYYLNGDFIENKTGDTTAMSSYILNMGFGVVGTSFMNGTIDEVLLYNKTLSSSEVTQIYKSGLSQHSTTNITLQTRTANSYNVSDVGLVSFWSFNNDNSSDAFDELGKNNGTYTSGALNNSSSGMVGNGAYFDGKNNFINISSSISLNTTSNGGMSVGFWVKNAQTNYASNAYPVSMWDTNSKRMWALLITSATEKWEFACSGDGSAIDFSSDIISADSNWHYIFVTMNESNTNKMTFYYDGIGYYTKNMLQSIGSLGSHLTIGGLAGSNYFNGSIDEVRIYNRTLSADEISDLYNLGSMHIADWSAWNNEGVVSDGGNKVIDSKSKFIQMKTILNTNQTLNSPYIISYNVTSTYLKDVPDVSFDYQIPTDISVSNAMGEHTNITYNITDAVRNLNLSSIYLYYKINSSSRTDIFFINGTAYDSWKNISYISNNSETFKFQLDDNELYPATYNFNLALMENMTMIPYTMTTQNDIAIIEFQNWTGSTPLNFFESNLHCDGTATLFFANSSYTTGNILLSSNVAEIYNGAITINHSHSTTSNHSTIQIPLNNNTQTINGIKVTSTSKIIIQLKTGTCKLYYIPNVTREGAFQTSGNKGVTITSNVGTADSHLHQYDTDDGLNYYACANDTANPINANCSSMRTDLYDIGNQPPSAPVVYNPENLTYEKGSLDINWTASVSPLGYSMSAYNISLLNADFSFNKSIAIVDGAILSYRGATSSIVNGSYRIGVTVNSTINNQATGYGFNFYLIDDVTKPFINITSPNNATYYSTNIALNVFCNDTNSISSHLYSIDGVANVSFTPNITIAVTGYEVYHTAGIFCNDSFNNWAWEYRKFYVGNYPATNGSASGYAYADASRKAGYCNSKLPGGHNC